MAGTGFEGRGAVERTTLGVPVPSESDAGTSQSTIDEFEELVQVRQAGIWLRLGKSLYVYSASNRGPRKRGGCDIKVIIWLAKFSHETVVDSCSSSEFSSSSSVAVAQSLGADI